MAAARAAESWLEAEKSAVRLLFVWLPMVPGDDEHSAQKIAGRLDDQRASHFWDPERHVGKQFARLHLPFADSLLEACREDEELSQFVQGWRENPEHATAWDIAYFFPAGLAWESELPEPASWTKQFLFFGEDGCESMTGQFWTRETPKQFVESNWREQFFEGMRRCVAPVNIKGRQ